MNFKYQYATKILLSLGVIALAGCATEASHHELYKKAIQTAFDKKITARTGGNGICFETTTDNSLSIPNYKYIADQCLGSLPKGAQFSYAKSASQEFKENLSDLEKGGLIKTGKPYTCHYAETNLFGMKNSYQVMMTPVYIKSTTHDVRFHQRVVNTMLGHQKNGYLCIGHFEVTKIVSATKPHYNSQYSMKTSYVVANIGLRGMMRVEKNNPALLKKIDAHTKDIKKIKNSLFTIKAVLGEESAHHWEVVEIKSLS